MSAEVAQEMISQLMSSDRPVSFSWQGGEPTLMGLDFFREVIELEKDYGSDGQRVSNSLQTNGILLDEEWARFLARYNFLVGLSLDGPRDLHDAHRKYPDGRGSWNQVLEAGKLLKENGVHFNILSVLSSKTVKQPKRILNFFLEREFRHLQFIPAIETEANEGAELARFSPDPLEVGKFYDQIFKEWSKTFPPRFSVRYFDALIARQVGAPSGFCKIEPQCGSYLVVEHNGDLYPCDFFVGENLKLGNLREDLLQDIENQEQFGQFAEGKSEIPSICQQCEHLDLCHGGCQYYRGLPEGPEERTYLCEGYQYFLSRNRDALETIADKLRKARSSNTRFGTTSRG